MDRVNSRIHIYEYISKYSLYNYIIGYNDIEYWFFTDVQYLHLVDRAYYCLWTNHKLAFLFYNRVLCSDITRSCIISCHLNRSKWGVGGIPYSIVQSPIFYETIDNDSYSKHILYSVIKLHFCEQGSVALVPHHFVFQSDILKEKRLW